MRVGLHGARRTIDLGKANGEHFGVMAGAGLDAFMIRDADAGGLKDRIGSLAYVFSGSKNLTPRPRADADRGGRHDVVRRSSRVRRSSATWAT